MIKIVNNITGTGKTKTVHLINDNPSNKSLASLILLNNFYYELENEEPIEYSYKNRKKFFSNNASLQIYFNFKKNFLENILSSKKDLVCKYCGKTHLQIGYTTLKDSHLNDKIKNLATIDHVVPLSTGGELLDENNCVVACKQCNRKKGSKSKKEFLKELNLFKEPLKSKEIIFITFFKQIYNKFFGLKHINKPNNKFVKTKKSHKQINYKYNKLYKTNESFYLNDLNIYKYHHIRIINITNRWYICECINIKNNCIIAKYEFSTLEKDVLEKHLFIKVL